MQCPHCERDIPADAAFCIYCAAPIAKAEPVEPDRPATGSKIRLDPGQVAAASRRAPSKRTQPARTIIVDNRCGAHAPTPPVVIDNRRNVRPRKHRSDPSGGLFLVGLGILILTHTLWPGILLLIGLTHYVKENARGRAHRAVKRLVFFGGLGFLFWADLFWPGILLLLIAVHVLGSRRYAWGP